MSAARPRQTHAMPRLVASLWWRCYLRRLPFAPSCCHHPCLPMCMCRWPTLACHQGPGGCSEDQGQNNVGTAAQLTQRSDRCQMLAVACAAAQASNAKHTTEQGGCSHAGLRVCVLVASWLLHEATVCSGEWLNRHCRQMQSSARAVCTCACRS
jgi:hypothetical protein